MERSARRPRTNRVAPASPAVPPISMDALPAATRTPLLVRRQLIPTNPHAVHDRALERRKLLGRVRVNVRDATPATGHGLDIDQRQLIRVDATTPHRPSGLAPGRAQRLRPRPRRQVANRPLLRGGSQSCAGFPCTRRVLALVRRFLPSGGGGNRTRVRGRTGQSVYERSPCLISPGGRFTDNLPTGQPSCSVALRAIGSP